MLQYKHCTNGGYLRMGQTRSSIEIALEKLGVDDVKSPIPILELDNKRFKIIQSDLRIPSKIETDDGTNIILLNNVNRSCKELMFDVYQCAAHVLVRDGIVSSKDAKRWYERNDIESPDKRNLIIEMACDQYAIEKIKYTVSAPRSVLKDITMESARLLYPEFVMALIGKMCKAMNDDINLRRQYLAYLFSINSDIGKEESKRKNAHFVHTDKKIAPSDFTFPTREETRSVELSTMYHVLNKLNAKPNKLDSFDKSMSKLFTTKLGKIDKSDEIKEFIEKWVKPEYAKYRMMISELERTPQRKLISDVLFAIINEGNSPSMQLVENIRGTLRGEPTYQHITGLMSYNERNRK